jgi:hypothetical protein
VTVVPHLLPPARARGEPSFAMAARPLPARGRGRRDRWRTRGRGEVEGGTQRGVAYSGTEVGFKVLYGVGLLAWLQAPTAA